MRGLNKQIAAVLVASASVFASSCTGGEETAAQTHKQATPQAPAPVVDPVQRLQTLSPAIPIYAGADYRSDLTRRDSTLAANQFGPDTVVYTLSTNDSFPQVWHYYVVYLAQFRGFAPLPPFPPSNQVSRSMEIHLSEAMKDPFITGDTFAPIDKRVVLQVSENEGGNGSVIRYIVSPRVAPLTFASTAPAPAAVAPPASAVQPVSPALR